MHLLELHNLTKFFPVNAGPFRRTRQFVRAVDDVSLRVERGETLGLVGESGCGKSTLARLIVKLLAPTRGRIIFNGVDVAHLSRRKFRPFRRQMQIIFQDPFASLNPRMPIGEIIAEPLVVNPHTLTGVGASDYIAELLQSVGLRPDIIHNYPHEFSGGERQRICIARAIALKPELIVADEPVSSLDVAIQAEIIDLLIELQKKSNIAYVFISHDLRIVHRVSSRIAVMYLGGIVESLPAGRLKEAVHPYTQALVQAVPQADPRQKGPPPVTLTGEPPSPISPPTGCTFHPRCKFKENICMKEKPVLEEIDGDHYVACHYKN